MPLNAKTAKGGGKTYDPIPAGVYPARLAQVIDLGIQPQMFKGEEKTPRQTLMLTYELVDEFLPDEKGEPDESKPRWLSETIPLHNLNSERANSTSRYYALDPDVEADGDFTLLVDNPCNVTVVVNKLKDGRTVNKVANVASMRPRDAAKVEALKNPPKVFTMDNPDMEIFGSLPQWVQDKIKSSLEYAGSPLERLVAGGGKASSPATSSADDEVPNGPIDDEGEDDEDY